MPRWRSLIYFIFIKSKLYQFHFYFHIQKLLILFHAFKVYYDDPLQRRKIVIFFQHFYIIKEFFQMKLRTVERRKPFYYSVNLVSLFRGAERRGNAKKTLSQRETPQNSIISSGNSVEIIRTVRQKIVFVSEAYLLFRGANKNSSFSRSFRSSSSRPPPPRKRTERVKQLFC